MKLKFSVMLLSLIIGCFASAQESRLAAENVVQGKYEINGSFLVTAQNKASYGLDASLGYFYRDNVSVHASLGFLSGDSTVRLFPGVGAAYYFGKTAAFAPFVSQFFQTASNDLSNISGASNMGVLYMLNSQVGFRTLGSLSYPLKNPRPSFAMLGSLTFLF